jgi:hypothetical protein
MVQLPASSTGELRREKYLQTRRSFQTRKKGFASWWPEDGMTNHHVKLLV